MPPKRWGPAKKAPPADPKAALIEFICGEVRANNCLGLPEEEIAGMANTLLDSRTRAEVYDWCGTLMMGETFAAEVIKQRTDYGPPFEGESVPTRPSDNAAMPPLSQATKPAAQGNPQQAARGRGPRQAATAPSEASSGKSAGQLKAAAGKRKNRGVDINHMPQESKAVTALKPGRFECGCFATVHNYRGNCANCGRIICEQEADDYCYFCGLETGRCFAYEIAVQEGKLGEAAQAKDRESYEAAIARRDKLLEYAQNRAKRTSVIDDQSATLFSPQMAWMSPQERRQAERTLAQEELRKRVEQMHKFKGAYQIHLDFVSQNITLGARSVGDDKGSAAPTAEDGQGEEPDEEAEAAVNEAGVEDVELGVEPLPSLLQKIWYAPEGEEAGDGTGQRVGHRDGQSKAQEAAKTDKELAEDRRAAAARRYELVSKRVQQDYFADDVAVFAEEAAEKQKEELHFHPTQFDEIDANAADAAAAATAEAPAASSSPSQAVAVPSRFAVTPVMRLRDEGICLSMHQPWASLLVAGIKMHEGRVWGTDFRGRLWIHAASAQPVSVEEVEEHYAPFVPPGTVFPKHYPTKVLLGYVYVTDCLDREEYEKAFPPEERQEGSPYSFICVEPKMLSFPLPMSGNHKLFPLEHKVHVAAKKQLGEIA